MARSEQEDFQLYFSRVRPIYHQLFNLAHAVTGNCEQAEYCVQYAMLDCWASGDASASRHGFREGLRSAALHAALKLAGTEDVEFDWDGLRAAEDESDPLLRQIAQEPLDLRRFLALRYGCGLNPRRIAKLTGNDVSRVQTVLKRFELRMRRRLSASDRRRADSMLAHAVRNSMAHPSPLAPEMGGVFRSFQADAATITRPSRLPARIIHAVLAAILALCCIAAFWLVAVLMQPAVLEEEPAAQEEVVEVEAEA